MEIFNIDCSYKVFGLNDSFAEDRTLTSIRTKAFKNCKLKIISVLQKSKCS